MQVDALKHNSPKNILIRAPNPIGDLVMATAGFVDIRNQFPEARITIFVRSAQAKVINGCDFYDELIIDDSTQGLGFIFRLAKKLRKRHFDCCLLFTNSLRTAFIVTLVGIPARIGFAKGGQSLFLSQAVQPVFDENQKNGSPCPCLKYTGD